MAARLKPHAIPAEFTGNSQQAKKWTMLAVLWGVTILIDTRAFHKRRFSPSCSKGYRFDLHRRIGGFCFERQIEKRDFGGFDISGCKTVATDGREMTFDGPKNFVERRDCSFGIYTTEVLQDNSRSVPWCNLKIWQRSNLEIVF
jgi:hypothetical protein